MTWDDSRAKAVVDISVYGGSALVLTTDYRISTQDVDAVFKDDRAFARAAAEAIAFEFGWPPGWLDDGVKGFLSHRDADAEAKRLFRSYPNEAQPGLRVFVASPAYLFAMKCLAMRASGVEHSADIEDVRQLGRFLGATDAASALAVVSRDHASGTLPPKTRFGIEDIFGV